MNKNGNDRWLLGAIKNKTSVRITGTSKFSYQPHQSLTPVVVCWTLINPTCFMSVVSVDQYHSILLEIHLIFLGGSSFLTLYKGKKQIMVFTFCL